MTAAQLVAAAADKLKAAGVPEPELDARLLFFEAFHTDQVHFLMDRMRTVGREQKAEEDRYASMIEKRSNRIPVQQILGSQEFMGLTFEVTPDVLIPRQDTETLVEQVLKEQKNPDIRVLDLCTGSGCIAISLAVLGGYRDVTAADLSEAALKVARRNADRLLPEQKSTGKRSSFTLCQGNLFEALPAGQKFDVLTSNPPYIPTEVVRGLEPEVKEHEPWMALDGTEDGLEFYRRIVKESPRWLNPRAAVYLEIGYDQADAVSELLREAGFCKIEVIKDLPGLDRVVRAERKM